MKKLIYAIQCLVLMTATAFSQYTVTINGTVSKLSGSLANVFITIDPNAVTPVYLVATTDSTGYYEDSTVTSNSSGTVLAYIIDCNGDTIIKMGSYSINPLLRLTVNLDFDFCPNTSCNALYFKSQLLDSLTRLPIPFNVQITDLSTGTGLSYLWDFGDSTSSTSPSPTHTYAASGPYLLCLTVSNTTCSSTYCDSVTVDSAGNVKGQGFTIVVGQGSVMGISGPVNRSYGISLFPNPASGVLYIGLRDSGIGFRKASVLTISGQETGLFTDGNRQSPTASIDVSSLPSGLYLLKLEGENGISMEVFARE